MIICRTCLRPVEWVVTTAGKRMPLDPEVWHLAPGNGPAVGVTADGQVLRGVTASKYDPDAVEVRTSHFATCPQADGHRRIRAAAARRPAPPAGAAKGQTP